jgi:uncharacterized membrane protein
MAALAKSILINAPTDKVYDYLNEPVNLLEFWPSMVDVQDIVTLPNGGKKFKWFYKMAGMRLEGYSEDIEVIPNRKSVSKTTGAINGTQTWSFEPVNSATRVSIQIEYSVPLPVIGKLAESVVVKLNEHEAETLLANLKTRLES